MRRINSTFRGRVIGSLAMALAVGAAVASAEPPEYPRKTDGKRPALLDRLKSEVPPLKHPRGSRWPMILWECVSFEPQPPEVYKALLDRGITQHIRMDEKMIPTAQAIQKAGAPVIMMQGSGGPWPYDQAKSWAHEYDEGYTPKVSKSWWPSWKACPAVFEGWRVNADRIRQTLGKFKAAGVTVDAVWMDWEGEPSSSRAREGWENARHCKRCRRLIPPSVLADYSQWGTYCSRLYTGLLAAYLAAPVREVFPRCSLTNWMLVCSTPERPVRGWGNGTVAPTVPLLMTATNPVAYGNDIFWKFWDKSWPLNRRSVDRFYMHLLVRQVSDDSANKLAFAAELGCVPWVARWCPDAGDPNKPMISRGAYREALRHIWLRGADNMQVFNASRKGHEDIVFAEVADAVGVYDEMLAYGRFLDAGTILCCDVPDAHAEGVFWSGRRLGDEAIVRAIHQTDGDAAAKVRIEAWPGAAVEVEPPPEGATWLLKRDGKSVRAVRQ
ncbi:MAG: hypothetical protein WBF17_24545 [Phycisphaerae bacterium]